MFLLIYEDMCTGKPKKCVKGGYRFLLYKKELNIFNNSVDIVTVKTKCKK